MADYSTRETELQVFKATNSAGKSEDIYIDTATGEAVQRLQDEKFPWRFRKQQGLQLADVYKAAQLSKEADRVLSCSTWLEYLATSDGSKQQLHRFNACKKRLCPLCAARKAKLMATRLTKILARVKADHPDTQLIFLTLTMQNVPGDELRAALDLLTRAWFKLMHRRPVARAIPGWFRALEITRNRAQDTYHPHIHAVLVVEDSYFKRSNGLYLSQAKWAEMWQQSLQVGYTPIIDIRSTYVKNGKGKPNRKAEAAAAAAVEAAKYATKDCEYISPAIPMAEAAKVAAVYTAALHKKRLTAMAGWVADAAQQLALDDIEDGGDLVHDEDGAGELTEATAELLRSYGWHFGVGDHILMMEQPNPEYQGGGSVKED